MKRSKFNLSNYKLLTMDMGYLVPVQWYEVLPGDTWQLSTSVLLRTQPLLAPVMHPVKVRIHHWFCPNRILWDDFEDFITGGPDGNDASIHPYKAVTGTHATGTLYNYVGYPYNDLAAYDGGNINMNALPIRAYMQIWNEYYRDQDLGTAATIDTTSGVCSTSTNLRKVSWEKDYFTTARPWEQKGTEVVVPIGDDAPITGIGRINQTYTHSSQNVYETDGSGTRTYADAGLFYDSTNYMAVEEDPNNAGYPNIRADLTNATGVNINELRLAFALQRYQEARARYGSRYADYLSYLGVNGADRRPNKPVYLGGGRQTIQFSEVLSTDQGGGDVGSMFGHGISALKSNKFRRYFNEHGIIMTMISVIPKAIYAQSIPKKFLRTVKEDYYQRELELVGDQEVTNKEVYANHDDPDDVWGYQQRYQEYREEQSGIAGEFHDTLDHWHMARIYADNADPSLNEAFVQATPTTRIYASAETDQLYVMAYNKAAARRMVRRHPVSKII